MAEDKSIGFLDYLIILIKWKKFLIILFFGILILSYLAIFFLVPPKYESTALILPIDNQSDGGLSSLLQNFSDLPISIPGISSSGDITDLYNTIIYSRTNLEDVINKFHLLNDYGLESIEKGVKALESDILTDEPNDKSYSIKVYAITAPKAADMVNYIVQKLNNEVIRLNVAKSKDNRIFLQQRYNEVKNNLTVSEDSLKIYQQLSGILDAEEQTKSSIEEYAKIEADLAILQIKLSVLENLYGKDSPQYKSALLNVQAYQSKVQNLKGGQNQDDVLLATVSLPKKAMQYYRYFRDVEINEKILEFIVPLYEQAKFAEQKDIPILQVIDYGKAAEKRTYPKRTLTALIIAIIILTSTSILILLYELLAHSENPKVIFLRENLFRFKKINT